jgi:hypothetical protein
VKPEMEIYGYKDGVLLKAVDALLALSDADGEFFPLNDGQKGMSYLSRELVTAVNIAYHVGGNDPRLLSIAERQGRVLIDDAGYSVAAAIRDGKAAPFQKQSVNLSDGPDGKQGGVAILRDGVEDLELVFKYAAQGLSHGHYDKLSFSYYEKGDEVLQDYGLVRFVNIEQKGGGNYLKENRTWAKQSIAHNTLTLNQTSHFQGKYEIGSQHHSELHFFDVSDPDVQVVSAFEINAYPGSRLQRTMALINREGFEKPFLLDIFKVTSDGKNQYDLPFYYMGQVLEVNFEYETPSTLDPLGKENGYQHLYLEGVGVPGEGSTLFAWKSNDRFYSLTTATQTGDELLFTRLGATDPEFNLRRDAAFMVRRKAVGNTTFAATLESHGSYSPVSEVALNSNSNIAALEIVHDDEDYTAVFIQTLDGQKTLFVVANLNASASKAHQLEVGGRTLQWTGPFHYFE